MDFPEALFVWPPKIRQFLVKKSTRAHPIFNIKRAVVHFHFFGLTGYGQRTIMSPCRLRLGD